MVLEFAKLVTPREALHVSRDKLHDLTASCVASQRLISDSSWQNENIYKIHYVKTVIKENILSLQNEIQCNKYVIETDLCIAILVLL